MFMAALLPAEIVFIHRKGAKIAKKIFNEISRHKSVVFFASFAPLR
jgi:hypothetical protein